MEYLIGSVATFIMTLVLSNSVRKSIKSNRIKVLRYSQLAAFEQIKGYLPDSLFKIPRLEETQMSKHQKTMQIRVIFVGNEAYWIKDNAFYVATTIDGMIDHESAKVVDTIGMDKVQLDKMSFIVEKLTEDL
jgi:hypothetical protein